MSQPPVCLVPRESGFGETHGESFLQPVWNRLASRLVLLPKLRLCRVVINSSNGVPRLCHEGVESRKEGGETARAPLRLRRPRSRDHIRAGGPGHLLPGATLVHVLGLPLASARCLDRLRLGPERPQLLEASTVRSRQELKERMSLLPHFVYPVCLGIAPPRFRAGV